MQCLSTNFKFWVSGEGRKEKEQLLCLSKNLCATNNKCQQLNVNNSWQGDSVSCLWVTKVAGSIPVRDKLPYLTALHTWVVFCLLNSGHPWYSVLSLGTSSAGFYNSEIIGDIMYLSQLWLPSSADGVHY